MERFRNPLKNHLYKIDRHLYLSKSDEQYYEKYLRYVDPYSPEAHYKIGEKFEVKGEFDKALLHYNQAMQFHSPFYSQAKQSIALMEEKINTRRLDAKDTSKTKTKRTPISLAIMLCLLFLNIGLLFLLLSTTPLHTVFSSMKQWGTSKEIVYETVDTPYVFYIPQYTPDREVKRTIANKTRVLSKQNPEQNILLYGVRSNNQDLIGKALPITNDYQINNAFVRAEYYEAIDSAVKIRFLNERVNTTSIDPLTIIGTNIVRTALQSYIRETGNPPKHLTELVSDYPNNYLSYIPMEVMTQSNQIHTSSKRQQGGWVYNRDAADLITMFFPNIASEPIPYHPLEIIVVKDTYSLIVKNSDYIINKKNVGIGRNNLTPTGLFTIKNRVLQPKGVDPKAFGLAGLGMGDIAIHGTYDEHSIKNQLSLGCIRLSNNDMMDIFDFTPKGTHVTIIDHLPNGTNLTSIGSTNLLIPKSTKTINQTTPTTFYWAG